MTTSNTNNTGIMHLMTASGAVVCRRARAIMATTSDKFGGDPKPCKRCMVVFAKWRAKKLVA